jgi:hypothetical protein
MIDVIAGIIGGGDLLPFHVEKARKILTVLSHPTREMMETGGAFFMEGETSDNAKAAAIVFSAMIDTALRS